MIFDSLTLDNFGAYGGIQQANLNPEPGKPVILFGGMNGGGKTTMLDAIQLALYGSKAKISNRGKLAYKDYLRDSIHRGADPGEGASVSIRFRRMMDGKSRTFDLCRSWRVGAKGVEEYVDVRCDGLRDETFTTHWDEVIEGYLPSSIAHLFFFDGEQIKDLAEGEHAADILGTAVHSLLGLDIVDRLETDLKVFERRKRAEGVDEQTAGELSQLRAEIAKLDAEQEKLALKDGQLTNEAGRLAKEVLACEEKFKSEGGELFLERSALEELLQALRKERFQVEVSLREVSAGPLPLLILTSQLTAVEDCVRHERGVRHARALVEALDDRDTEVLAALKAEGIQSPALKQLQAALAKDRKQRAGLAREPLLLDAPDDMAPHVAHLRTAVLPSAQAKARELVRKIALLNEQIDKVESDLERVPSADRIALIQDALSKSRAAHGKKLTELNEVRMHLQVIRKQRAEADTRLDRVGQHDFDRQVAQDDRERMLKHSERVRSTLELFRQQVVRKHTTKLEALMLESFQKLLRKTELITGLSINAETFEPTLRGPEGRPLPFDRLSAGERQLLATSLLWGLARASGRPIPTIIDTPLGRLDSAHRQHLVDRYFPNASHQVILLSTDEEIMGNYLSSLEPFVARKYKLAHNEKAHRTEIVEGYFEQ